LLGGIVFPQVERNQMSRVSINQLEVAQTGRRTRRPVMSGRCKESFDVVRAEGDHRQPVADEIAVEAQKHRAVLDHRLI
jgi:hypothetical protein